MPALLQELSKLELTRHGLNSACEKRPLPRRCHGCSLLTTLQPSGLEDAPGWGPRASPLRPSRRALALLTEGGEAQHGDQQGVVPPAALIPGLPPVRQDVPVGGVI